MYEHGQASGLENIHLEGCCYTELNLVHPSLELELLNLFRGQPQRLAELAATWKAVVTLN